MMTVRQTSITAFRRGNHHYGKAVIIIRNFYSDAIRPHITLIDDPTAMWQIPPKRLDDTNAQFGRQPIKHKLLSTKLVPGRPIDEFLNSYIHIHYRNQINGSKVDISYMKFLNDIY